jgi:DNA modification methylase
MKVKQFALLNPQVESPIDNREWGTFKDSLRAPIHNWFTYPAGFSYKAVESSIGIHEILKGATIYDPFMGSGTTNLVAKKLSINSYGVEAHPFVFRITRTKINWEVDRDEVVAALKKIENQVKRRKENFNEYHVTTYLGSEFPELVLKCYEPKTLLDLFFIRNSIISGNYSQGVKDIFFVGLTSILRQVSTAATGWPYIAPKKQKTTSLNKIAFVEFARQINKMVSDIEVTVDEADKNFRKSSHKIFNADSRYTQDLIPTASVDHVFTSPPYLNNFDYADRTRLELYFWGEAKTWGDISEKIRTKLITSATTQISRNDPKYELSKGLQESCPDVYDFLRRATAQLGEARLIHGGKKSYDHLVSGYFNDMFLIISEVYRVLKNNTVAVFVLGDSAPYGVHIPTDDLIGKIGLGAGFSDYKINVLRARGEKWKENPQRHDVKLRESIVTLVKA